MWKDRHTSQLNEALADIDGIVTVFWARIDANECGTGSDNSSKDPTVDELFSPQAERFFMQELLRRQLGEKDGQNLQCMTL
jgi:hypothetical protein